MKIDKIIIGILIIGILGACIFLGISKSKTIKDNKNLKEEITKLKNELKLKQEGNTDGLISDTKECTYTVTYRFVDYYDYEGSVPESKFIVVDKFQEFSPEIIEYNTNTFNINFEKGSNYEFTFKAGIRNGRLVKQTLINIVKTDKTGLDQIQESCVIR